MKKSLHSREQHVLQSLLRHYREKSGLKQEELAGKLETYQTFVSKYETGERILDLPELRQVCQALGVSLAEFIKAYEDSLSELDMA